jgi:putative MATE family efflux protein
MVVQFFISSSLNLVDTIMVGQLGETEIASVGLSNQIFFLLNLFLFGVGSGASIFTAQFWGKRDIRNIHRVLGLAILSGLAVSVVFFLSVLLAPKQILGIFSTDPNVLRLGSEYLGIVCFSYIIMSLTFNYASVLRSTEHVKLPMYVSIAALSTNTILNYIMIFGKLGFPAMGVRGAALATVIARGVEFALLITVVYARRYAPAARIHEMFDISVAFFKRFYSTTVPVILNESIWSLGITMFSVVYARMGTGIVASINIVSTVERLSLVLFTSMAHSCAVMIGKQIGAGDEDRALLYAKRFELLGPLLGVVIGAILALSSGFILSAYRVSPEVSQAAQTVLIILTVIIPVKVFNMISIVGVLRSGGDTKFCLAIDTVPLWLIGVPLAFLGGLVWKLPVHCVYMLVCIEEFVKFGFGLRRILSAKWINNLVRHAG